MRPRVILFLALILTLGLTLSACDINMGNDEEADVAETPTMAADASAAEATETPANDETDAPAVAQQPSDGTPQATPDAEAADTGDSAGLISAISDVSNMVRPSVAFIAVQSEGGGVPGSPGGQQGVGSGVLFDEEGHILTNNHVIENAQEMTVVLPGEDTRYTAELVGRSPSQDLAVIQIDGEDLPVAALGDSDALELGEWVVAIGNALGLPGGPTVTAGVVSATDRTIETGQQQQVAQASMEDLIQTDAAINPGNSGGPLVNLQGEVIGINTASIQGSEGIGFAIPINTAQRFIDEVMTGEPQAFLGITGATVTSAVAERFNLQVESGVLVAQVEPDGPAAEAGIQPGDVIVAFDGQPIESSEDLQAAIDEHSPGDTVTVTVNRGGQEQELTVTLGESQIIR